jgi:hypothetical protein
MILSWGMYLSNQHAWSIRCVSSKLSKYWRYCINKANYNKKKYDILRNFFNKTSGQSWG